MIDVLQKKFYDEYISPLLIYGVPFYYNPKKGSSLSCPYAVYHETNIKGYQADNVNYITSIVYTIKVYINKPLIVSDANVIALINELSNKATLKNIVPYQGEYNYVFNATIN